MIPVAAIGSVCENPVVPASDRLGLVAKRGQFTRNSLVSIGGKWRFFLAKGGINRY